MVRVTALSMSLFALLSGAALADEVSRTDETAAIDDPKRMEAPVSAELAGRAWAAMEESDMADLNRAVEAMAEMDPDGEMSAESMARLAEIAPAAGPVDVNAAKATVQGLGNDAVAVLAANGADERARVRDFDIPLIARFALGRYWRSTTAAQREAYTAAFADAIVSAYAHRLSDIELDRFRVTDAEQSGKHDVLVHSLITRPGKEAVRLIWRVRARDDGRYRVIDVVFEGISMALTKREEYAAIIQASGGRVDALIEKMIAKES